MADLTDPRTTAAQGAQVIDLGKVTTQASKPYLCPVLYANHYLANIPGLLTPPRIMWLIHDHYLSESFLQYFKDNAIALDPRRAGLPWHTGLDFSMQNKHWEKCVEASKSFLQCLLEASLDSNGTRIPSSATEQLEQKTARLPIHMFPFATPERLVLLAEANEIIFFFDDVWEDLEEDEVCGNFSLDSRLLSWNSILSPLLDSSLSGGVHT